MSAYQFCSSYLPDMVQWLLYIGLITPSVLLHNIMSIDCFRLSSYVHVHTYVRTYTTFGVPNSLGDATHGGMPISLGLLLQEMPKFLEGCHIP